MNSLAKHCAIFISILTLSIYISGPMFKAGLYTMHDDQQVARLFLFDEAIKAGEIPPRWVNSLGFGFGYPLFNFYPPFVYFVGELVHMSGFGYIDSIKIIFFLSIFLSGLSMFFLTKYLFGYLSGIGGSIFYMFAPYRALDIYVRGALAEAFSFVWLPLIILFIIKLKRQPNLINSVLLSLFLSLLMLTHNLIFLPFILIIFLFFLMLLFISKNKLKFSLFLLSSFILVFLLTAFFWIPAIFEKKYTIVDDLLIVNLASYKIHFVYPIQLWNWTWGFGGSSQGILDGISFKIGKLHILASLMSAIISTIILLKAKLTSHFLKSNLFHILIFFILFILSAYMTTYFSQPIWNLIPQLAYLQFPWRFLTFVVLTSSILAGGLVYIVRVPVLKYPISIILVTLVLSTSLKLFKPQFYRPGLTDSEATSSEVIKWDVSSSSFEYSPKGVELIKNDRGANILNISQADIPREKVSVLSGSADINIDSYKPQNLEFSANVKNDSKIQINTFDFPGWHLYVNDKEQNFTSDNKFKLISFDLKKGDYNIMLKFQNTPIRNFANYISVISFLLLIGYFIKKWRILNFLSTLN